MAAQMYVFDAELVGFGEVCRVVGVRSDLELVDLHYALQSAFVWDDDHLYAFWLSGAFWPGSEPGYVHPSHATSRDPLRRSAAVRLDELALVEGQRLAYVFDFGQEWRVALTVRDICPADGAVSARLLDSVGVAPRQPGLFAD